MSDFAGPETQTHQATTNHPTMSEKTGPVTNGVNNGHDLEAAKKDGYGGPQDHTVTTGPPRAGGARAHVVAGTEGALHRQLKNRHIQMISIGGVIVSSVSRYDRSGRELTGPHLFIQGHWFGV